MSCSIDYCNHDNEHIPSLCVSKVPIFNHLPIDILSVIAQKATMRTYQKGQLIHKPNDNSSELFIVHKGRIKIYYLSSDGKQQLVRFLEAGDFAGEMALFSATKHDSYAQATTTSEICMIYQSDIQDLLKEHPEISLHVLAELSKRLGESEKQTVAIATTSVNNRIAQYLIDLSNQQNSLEINLPMSRRYLASFLGTTPETISRRLGEFEEAGWIKQQGQRNITIIDIEGLWG